MTSKILNFLNKMVGMSLWAMPFSAISIVLGYVALRLGEPSGALSLKLGIQGLGAEVVSLVFLLLLAEGLKQWGGSNGKAA